MKVKLNKIEAEFILNWSTLERKSNYGSNEFIVGEEDSILSKIKSVEDSVEMDFNLVELEILLVWADRNNGVMEELEIKKKLEEAYKIEMNNFKDEMKD